MYKIIVLTIVAISSICSISEARKLGRCDIVRELRWHGFPEHLLSNWVCLIESESSGRTHVVGPPNGYDGSRDYGLFQINDRYWCSDSGWPGKDCYVTCNELLSDDISRASECAKIIFRRHGFSAWYGWQYRCQGRPLPDISYCY